MTTMNSEDEERRYAEDQEPQDPITDYAARRGE
jgi:hypothetical protein